MIIFSYEAKKFLATWLRSIEDSIAATKPHRYQSEPNLSDVAKASETEIEEAFGY